MTTCGVHLCDWSQDGVGVGVCFVFLMAFGDGGFDGDASMADFEERLLTESIRIHVQCKLITFFTFELHNG